MQTTEQREAEHEGFKAGFIWGALTVLFIVSLVYPG